MIFGKKSLAGCPSKQTGKHRRATSGQPPPIPSQTFHIPPSRVILQLTVSVSLRNPVGAHGPIAVATNSARPRSAAVIHAMLLQPSEHLHTCLFDSFLVVEVICDGAGQPVKRGWKPFRC